jgi:hypothetical protein
MERRGWREGRERERGKEGEGRMVKDQPPMSVTD